MAAVADGPVDVGPEDDTVLHGDRHVPVDAHAVADVAPEIGHAHASLIVEVSILAATRWRGVMAGETSCMGSRRPVP